MLLSDCIEDMKKEYEVSCGWPITDDSQSLQRFCSKLEHLLQIGLRGTTVPNAVIFVVRGCDVTLRCACRAFKCPRDISA